MSAEPGLNRHQQRIERIQALFSWDFQPESQDEDQFDVIRPILENIEAIDETLFRFAQKRTKETFDKVDLAILRQGLYELMYTSTPVAVVINEAIELAKEFADESSAGFIHGVLANYADERKERAAHESRTDDSSHI